MAPPAIILMAGLQGAGKTTTVAQARAPPAGPAEEEGAGRVGRRLPAGRDRAAEDRRRAGRHRFLSVDGAGRADRDRHRRGRLGAQALSRRADRRHRGPPRDRRGDDGRDQGAARPTVAGRDAVRRRRDGGPGRDQHREGVRRSAAADRHRAHQARRRLARRRRAVGAPRHRQADQVRRGRREARRARGVPSRPHGQPHPRHGRHRRAGRGGAARRRHGRGARSSPRRSSRARASTSRTSSRSCSR